MRICEQVGAKIYKTNQAFWTYYRSLPREIQRRADKNFDLLKQDPEHPSLSFKKVGKTRWSVRVSRNYRALAREEDGTLVWFWIGKHDEYMRRIHQ